MEKKLSIIAKLIVGIALISLSGRAPALAQEGWPNHIALSAMGGTQWVVAVGMAAQIDKYTPSSCTALGPTAGTTANLLNLMAGKAEVALNSNPAIYEAWSGTGEFEKHGPQKWLRTISRGWVTNWHIITSHASGLKTFPDIKGKRFADNLVGSSMTQALRKGLLELYGISEKDYRSLPFTKYSECVSMLSENRADAVALFGGLPSPQAVELASKMDIHLIDLGEEAKKKLHEFAPGFYPGIIPAGTYKGQEEDVSVGQTLMTFMTHENVSPDVVYGICQALWDHPEELEPIHPNFRQFARNPASELVVVPYHDGAVKYYKDKGLWTKELEARQSSLLSK